MKKEANKKNKRFLWISLGIVVLLAAAVAAVFLLPALNLGKDATPANNDSGRPELYWNVDRDFYTANSESGLSTREAAEDGLYHIRFAYNGKHVEYTASDKQLVNYIDSMDVMGLTLDDDNQIVEAIDPKDIAKEVAKDFYVHSIKDNVLILNSSIAMNGMKFEIPITDLTECYDVSADAETEGQLITLSDFRVMDTVFVYANNLGENTHVYLKSHSVQSKIYWRADSFYDSNKKSTTRTPDENGVYSISVFCEGELETLKTKDVAIVTAIDSKNIYRCVFGCQFDEEGYVIKLIDSALSIHGVLVTDRYDITQLDGNTFVADNLIQSNGNTYTGTLTDDCVIYDVSKAALAEGRRGKPIESLQLGDRITTWTDTTGKIVLIYVSNRLVDSAPHFNVSRKYDATSKETTRVPNAEGYYEVELLVDGVVKTYKTKDKSLVTYLDSIATRMVGLKTNGNIIEYVYEPVCIFGSSSYSRYVESISGSVATLVTADGSASVNTVLTPDCKVYNVSNLGTYGEETTVKQGDYVYAFYQPTKELVLIYVARRYVEDAEVYWNLNRKYDSQNKVTTREPDADGWYVFDVALNGKQTTVKTKSKSIATKMDAYSPEAFGLVVSGGIVQTVCDPEYATGGLKKSIGHIVTDIRSDGVDTYYKAGDSRNTLVLSDNCKIYNVSTAFSEYKGETTSLRIGDRLAAYTNMRGEAVIIFVRNRDVDDMYYKTEQMYSTSRSETSRKPDADGWYIYNVTVNGVMKTVKTQDKAVASQMDYYSGGFGMMLNGDIIKSVVSFSSVKNVAGNGVRDWTVVSVNGKQVTVKYNKLGTEDTGKTQVITLASNAKIYDVSPGTAQFGAVTQLRAGDSIRTYIDDNDKHLYVYVQYRDTRVAGQESYCDHCDQVVYWNPWNGGGFVATSDHYYLCADAKATGTRTIGNDSGVYEIVLDLNGKTLTAEGHRALTVYKGSTLTIMDCAGNGAVAATGSTGAYGGVVMVTSGGTLNLHSGTLKQQPSDKVVSYGGVVYVSSEGSAFNMHGGTVADGKVYATEKFPEARGGNIYVTGGTFTMTGGTVTGGESQHRGGNVYTSASGSVNMIGGTITVGSASRGGNLSGYGKLLLGGTISDGTAAKFGGNIDATEGTITIIDAKISGGKAGQYGGNIYVIGDELNITGGHITGGSADTYGGNVFVNSSAACDISISGGVIDGDVRLNSAKSLVISGAPKIGIGSEGGIKLANGALITIGDMQEGAEIYVDSNGIFTKPIADAENYVDYFKYSGENGMIYVESGALAVGIGLRQAYCAHCDETVDWKAWSGKELEAFSSSSDALLQSGHYYLAEDLTTQRQVNIGSSDNKTADFVLDLQGKNWTNTARRAFLVYGTMSIVDTEGTGSVSGAGVGNGGVVMLSGGTFNLYGGTLYKSAEASQEGRGGTVYCSGSSTFNMLGGVLQSGTAAQGGNIYSTNSTVNIVDGSIMNGTATEGSNCYFVSGNVNISGATMDGEVKLNSDANLTVSGNAAISNLNIPEGTKITLGDLSESAKIYVTANGVFTTANDNAQSYLDAGYVVAPSDSFTLKVVENAMVAEPVVIPDAEIDPNEIDNASISGKFTEDTTLAVCPKCGGEPVVWTALNDITTGGSNLEAGHYYLTGDYNTYLSISGEKEICIHLNGYNWNQAVKSRALYLSGNDNCVVNIMGEGTVSGSDGYTGRTARGATIEVNGSGAVLNLLGGVYTKNTHNSSEQEISGPTIALYTGGGVINLYEKATVEASNGPEISVTKGNLNIHGGVVNGETVISKYGQITLSGSPIIENLDLTAGALAQLDALTDGTEIFVTAEGKFTKETENAEDYLSSGYIKAISDTVTIIVQKNCLVALDGLLANGIDNSSISAKFQDGTTLAACPKCGGEPVVWTALNDITTGGSNLEAGHYYLTGDYGTYLSISGEKEICIHLNGYNWNQAVKSRALYLSGANTCIVNIMGEGTVCGSDGYTGRTARGATVEVNGSGVQLNLFGGVYTKNTHNSSEQEISGPTIALYTGGGEINMYNGVVLSESIGTEIAVTKGSLNFYGGTVNGAVTIGADGAVALSGATIISELDLTSGVVANVGMLTENALIAVLANANTPFTASDDAIEDYAEYFKSADPSKDVAVESGTLILVEILLAHRRSIFTFL